MRTLIAVGFLAVSVGAACAAYLVELDAGDRMTVDSYWEDGDRVHLRQDGVDIVVPKSRVRGIVEKAVAPAERRGAVPSSSAAASAR